AVKATHGPQVLTGLSDFGGLFALEKDAYEEPVLVSGTDSVGTKVKIAFALDKHDTIGYDVVAMCADDVVTLGAKPLFFLDYIGCHTVVAETVASVVEGVAKACEAAGCALIGGEVAELSDMYQPGEYDLVGFCVGVVERARIIDGSGTRKGDAVIGIASSGLHSNGFSLVRKVLLEDAGLPLDEHVPELGRRLGEELLEPTRIYAGALQPVLANYEVHAVAHITGGGIPGNLSRVLPDDLAAHIDVGAWPRPAVFDLVQEAGGIADEEMVRVFNLGLGMMLVAPSAQADGIAEDLASAGHQAYVVGSVVEREDGPAVIVG
ncbi:MAG: phosphoribosylformylglycinamidine cyclo-ligase, partial [Armatimonadota bacterium]